MLLFVIVQMMSLIGPFLFLYFLNAIPRTLCNSGAATEQQCLSRGSFRKVILEERGSYKFPVAIRQLRLLL